MNNRIQVILQQENIQLEGNNGIFVKIIPITPDSVISNYAFSFNEISSSDGNIHSEGDILYTSLASNEIFITDLTSGDIVIQFTVQRGNYPPFRYTTNFNIIPVDYVPSSCSTGSLTDKIIIDNADSYYYNRSDNDTTYSFTASYLNPLGTGSLPQCGGFDQNIYYDVIGGSASGGDINPTTSSIGSDINILISNDYGVTSFTQPNDSLISVIVIGTPSGNGACCFGRTELVLTCPEENLDEYFNLITPTPTNTSTPTLTPTNTNTPTPTITTTPTLTQIEEDCVVIEYESLEHACSIFNNINYPYINNIEVYVDGYLNINDFVYTNYNKLKLLPDGFYVVGCCGTEVSIKVINGIIVERRLCAIPLSPTPTSTPTLTPTTTPKHISKEIIIHDNNKFNYIVTIIDGAVTSTYSGSWGNGFSNVFARVGSLVSIEFTEPSGGSAYGYENYLIINDNGPASPYTSEYQISVQPTMDFLLFKSFINEDVEANNDLSYKSHSLRYYYIGSDVEPTTLNQTSPAILYTETNIYPHLVINAKVYKYYNGGYEAADAGYYYLRAYSNQYIKIYVFGGLIKSMSSPTIYLESI